MIFMKSFIFHTPMVDKPLLKGFCFFLFLVTSTLVTAIASYLILRSFLEGKYLLLPHCTHNRHQKVFSLSKPILNLQTQNSVHGQKTSRKIVFYPKEVIEFYTNTYKKNFSIKGTWLSRFSSVGSLRSSLVLPFSVRRLTYKKNIKLQLALDQEPVRLSHFAVNFRDWIPIA